MNLKIMMRFLVCPTMNTPPFNSLEMRSTQNDAAEDLKIKGWSIVKWPSQSPLLELARRFGEPLSVKEQTMQLLRPRPANLASFNTASSIHGLGVFPPHTDFAHWPKPPKLLVLRNVGEPSTTPTIVLDTRLLKLESKFGRDLHRAVWRVARVRRGFLCSICFESDGESGFRWDADVMKPYGDLAEKVSPIFINELNYSIRYCAKEVFWTSSDFALVIDNWRMLHARAAIAEGDDGRVLERIII